MALILHPDGSSEQIAPTNGHTFSLEELKRIVGEGAPAGVSLQYFVCTGCGFRLHWFVTFVCTRSVQTKVTARHAIHPNEDRGTSRDGNSHPQNRVLRPERSRGWHPSSKPRSAPQSGEKAEVSRFPAPSS